MIVRTILAVRALGIVVKNGVAVLRRSTTSENLVVPARFSCWGEANSSWHNPHNTAKKQVPPLLHTHNSIIGYFELVLDPTVGDWAPLVHRRSNSTNYQHGVPMSKPTTSWA